MHGDLRDLGERAAHAVGVHHRQPDPRGPGDGQQAVPAADLDGHQRRHLAPRHELQMLPEPFSLVPVLELFQDDRGGTDPGARHDQRVIGQFVQIDQREPGRSPRLPAMPAAVSRTHRPRHLRRGWRSPGTGPAASQGRAVSSWSPALAVMRFRCFSRRTPNAEHRTGYLAAFDTSANIRQGVMLTRAAGAGQCQRRRPRPPAPAPAHARPGRQAAGGRQARRRTGCRWAKSPVPANCWGGWVCRGLWDWGSIQTGQARRGAGRAAAVYGQDRGSEQRQIIRTCRRARLVTGGLPPGGSGHEGPWCSCRVPPSAGSTWAAAHKAGRRRRATRASPGTRGRTATSPGPCLSKPSCLVKVSDSIALPWRTWVLA